LVVLTDSDEQFSELGQNFSKTKQKLKLKIEELKEKSRSDQIHKINQFKTIESQLEASKRETIQFKENVNLLKLAEQKLSQQLKFEQERTSKLQEQFEQSKNSMKEQQKDKDLQVKSVLSKINCLDLSHFDKLFKQN
jgi:predicted  nucleic acid-binding Zn-ribbon protein